MAADRELIKTTLEFSQKLNVLYAEDDEVLLKATVPMFEQWFNNVRCCKDGQEAFDLFKNSEMKFDLIITDINMPNLSGLDFVEKVRQIDEDIKIIIISAHDDTENLLKSINLHVNDFLPKPYDMLDLAKILKSIKEKNLTFATNKRELEERFERLVDNNSHNIDK
jgi:YesN/AraC family two-component response regulator